MGQDKEARLRQEQGAYDAARRDGRRCELCNAVIPFGESPGGQSKLCVSCYSSMNKDD